MKKANACVTRLTVVMIVLVSLAQTKLAQRAKQLDNDRGDIPGWAIAAAAACVFGALVYAAVSGVVTKYIGKIK
jgi:ABC-type Co2+ transport system permease subunit